MGGEDCRTVPCLHCGSFIVKAKGGYVSLLSRLGAGSVHGGSRLSAWGLTHESAADPRRVDEVSVGQVGSADETMFPASLPGFPPCLEVHKGTYVSKHAILSRICNNS